MEFWDREREIEYLKRYIRSEPNAILFVYGPKSSGKSTLLMKVMEILTEKGLSMKIYWYDLRGKLISDYRSVIEVFFREKGWGKKMLEGISKLLKFRMDAFELDGEEMTKVLSKKLDAFEIMESTLIRDKESEKIPVIVFDEIQKLKEVYLNSPSNQRPLIKELFNFFVRLTKVLHLSHVIVMTSDTFFIERVYTDSTLKNTSEYYLVDFFDDDTAFKILKGHGFSDETARYVIDWVGGVPWMLERVISRGVEVVKELYIQVKSRLFDFLIDYQNEEGAKRVLREIMEGDFMISKENINIVKDLVEAEILFYDPVGMTVKFQTKLDERSAKELLQVVE